MSLEVLNFALVLFRRGAGLERTKIAAAFGLRINFTRIQPVAALRELANHVPPNQTNVRVTLISSDHNRRSAAPPWRPFFCQRPTTDCQPNARRSGI
jgi:hypothetical protein